jgi:hypothetical protein
VANKMMTPAQRSAAQYADVRRLLKPSQIGRDALQFIDKNKIGVQFREGGGSKWVASERKIYIDSQKAGPHRNRSLAAQTLIHEVHHAKSTINGTAPQVMKQNRADFVNAGLREEASGTAAGFLAQLQLNKAWGVTAKPVTALEAGYREAYSHGGPRFQKMMGGRATPEQMEKASAQAGYNFVLDQFQSGKLRQSGTGLQYPDALGRYWDSVRGR